MRSPTIALLFLASAFALPYGPPRRASACTNDGWEEPIDRLRASIWRTEELVHRNEPERALRRAARVLRSHPEMTDIEAIRQIAIVRLDGDVRQGAPHPRPRTTLEERDRALRAATAFFEDHRELRGVHHTLWHAEALATLPEHRVASEALLVTLRARGHEGTSLFQATVARIRLRAGDLVGARVAYEACLERAGSTSRAYCPRVPRPRPAPRSLPGPTVVEDPWG